MLSLAVWSISGQYISREFEKYLPTHFPIILKWNIRTQHSHSLFHKFFFTFSINKFTSALGVEEQVRVVGYGYNLGPQSYLSSLRPNLRLASPRIHGWIRLVRGNTDYDVCIQYALLDQGSEGAYSWFRMGLLLYLEGPSFRFGWIRL